MRNLGKYAKSVMAFVAGGLTWGITVIDSPAGGITRGEWKLALAGLGTLLGVYAVPNSASQAVVAEPIVIDEPVVPQV